MISIWRAAPRECARPARARIVIMSGRGMRTTISVARLPSRSDRRNRLSFARGSRFRLTTVGMAMQRRTPVENARVWNARTCPSCTTSDTRNHCNVSLVGGGCVCRNHLLSIDEGNSASRYRRRWPCGQSCHCILEPRHGVHGCTICGGRIGERKRDPARRHTSVSFGFSAYEHGDDRGRGIHGERRYLGRCRCDCARSKPHVGHSCGGSVFS
jgi:hypothetical protein